MKQQFSVNGMSCAACSAHVDKAVRGVPGVSDVSVNLLANSMTVIYDSDTVNDASIINAVIHAGYGASVMSGFSERDKKLKTAQFANEYKKAVVKLNISVICLLMLMYIGMGGMMGLPLGPFDKAAYPFTNAISQLVLASIVIVINFNYYISGFTKLFRLAPNMDSLVSMGSAISFVYSTVLFVRITFIHVNDPAGATDLANSLYYESAAMILVFVSIGKTLEARSKVRTRDSIEDLIKLKPETANRLVDGKEEIITLDQINVGDRLILRSGQQVPADGIVISGSCSVDESVLTGESIPVDKTTGDEVFQATVSSSGYIEFRVTKSDSDSALSKIIRTVEEASASKAPVSRLADRISAVFVPVVFGISLVTYIVWRLTGADISKALNYAISVIVISCPCSLGLATPTAITVGTGKAAKLGILFKSAAVLENCHDIDTVVLDKTGTVTTGTLSCPSDCIVTSGETSKPELINLAGSIEKQSNHPIGRCIYEFCSSDAQFIQVSVSDYVEHPGGGISCTFYGSKAYAGNYRFVSQFAKIDESVYNSVLEKGVTPILFALDDRFVGIISVEDEIKRDSKAAVAGLKNLSTEVYMLTGDVQKTAEAIASKSDISNVKAEVRPEEKEEFVRSLMNAGRKVAMIGDGINDAPALTTADVGIAIGTGTDIAIDSADIILTHGSLIEAVNAIDLSRRVMRNIRQNLFWAFFYNCLGIPVAAGVFTSLGLTLNPMISAALMSCSSLFVVSNALRLNLYKPKLVWEEKTMKIKMIVEGMMCMHCRAHVEKALNGLAGITATVDLESKTATIEAARDISDEELTKAVTDAGYEVVSISR